MPATDRPLHRASRGTRYRTAVCTLYNMFGGEIHRKLMSVIFPHKNLWELRVHQRLTHGRDG